MSRWFVAFFDAFKCTYVVWAEALDGASLMVAWCVECARPTHARPAGACRIPEKERVASEELTRRDA